MQYTGDATTRPLAFSLAIGLLGGAAIIMTRFLTSRGPMVLLPYAVLMFVTALYLRVEHVQTFRCRFLGAFRAFATAAVIHYTFILTVTNRRALGMELFGHAWRLAMLGAIGALLSAAVAQLTTTRSASES